MRFKSILALAACALLASTSAQAKSAKRGVSENQFQYKAQMAALEPGVTWFYTWGGSVGRYLAGEQGMEFVPMCWNSHYDAASIREYVQAHPEVKYLLGFNEPNFTNQANMTPAEAAAAWPGVQALAKELGLKLVSPALNYSPNPPYQSPTQWMDEFVALVGKDAFDYLAVHSYGGFGVAKELCTTFHERYGKEVWLTEFCYWPNEGDPNSTVAPEAQIASMMQTVEWLEKTPWIFRYAWFKPIGTSTGVGPNFGLLISGKGEAERELSPQGLVYLNMPDFDADTYNPIEEFISPIDYYTQYGCVMDKSANENNPKGVEISSLNAGAWIDYKFDVPESGAYYLVLEVSGQGEPARFDPMIGVYAVNADETQGTELCAPFEFQLSGENDSYTQITFPVTLAAGKQTLRIADGRPYQPSGIRVGAIKLSTQPGAGAHGVVVERVVDVFSLQGIKVRSGVERSDALRNLPVGIYIIEGKKVIVK